MIGKAATHKKTMIAAAISALIFFIIYASRTVFIGNSSFGGPEELEIYYTLFLIFHIFLATSGAIFGIVTLTLAFKRKIKKHRKIGPVTSIIWFFTAITGVMVYLLLYILYDSGETTSMIKAILGS
ncbi:membrane protein [Oceanobacillus picturae]|uniref:Membrane protein n=1 Tax=Oceanobacillus picturae TaxID=171693 RepID=A0A0U9HAF8_9BACI|nr:membrane protein [Oceanobacillus picturae]